MALSSVVSVHAIKPPREKPPKEPLYNDFYSAPPGYQNYNCYAYAIGKKTTLYPGQLSGYSDTIDSDTDTKEIYRRVTQDLSACGYTKIRKVSSSYVLKPGESMLAFIFSERLTIYGGTPQGWDVHAWIKRSNGDYWYHKMSNDGAIMRMKAGVTPQSSGKTDESFKGDGSFKPGVLYYTGDIQYFAFTTALSVNGEPEQEQEG